MDTCYQHITVLPVGNQYKMKSSAMVYKLRVFENCLYNWRNTRRTCSL